MNRHSKPRVIAAGGGWHGWACPACHTVSDALYLDRQLAQASLNAHLTDRHRHTHRHRPWGRWAA